ncbi:hypothetical protein BG004_000763 [Podila humilis]|nr:hypothetical protein BG004_000763 [Podila humilis]
MANSGLGHHSPSSSMLLNRNTASRPPSPSNGPFPLSQSHSHSHKHTASAVSDHSSSSSSAAGAATGATGVTMYDSNDNSNYVGRFTEKNESYFPTVDVSNDGNPLLGGLNSSTKRSRFGHSSSSSSGFNNARRWRWWNYTAAILMAFAIVEALIMLLGSSALYSLPDQIQIDSRDFRKVTYQGLALDSPSTLKKPVQVYHVTKEFGPASMGGLGMVVTALASAQQRARTQKVNIVMPYYSMLNQVPGVNIRRIVSLTFNVKDKHQKTIPLIFNVYSFKYVVQTKASDMEGNNRPIYPITAWLIGPGDVYPFDLAFKSKNTQEIYYSPKGLPGEWKDLYFAKAAATFIQYQNKNDDVSLFASAAVRVIDVVHVHGATNALVLHYLQQSIDKGSMGEEPPALIYTLHDYLDELQYSNEIVNVQKFMDKSVHSDDDEEDMYLQMEGISPYCHGHRMFTSAMGIDLADAVTFVSKTLAKDIVEGRLDFYLKELVLGSILNQAEKNLFIGITNGVDFGSLNPWTMPELRKNNLAFPSNDLMEETSSGSGTMGNSTEGDEEEQEEEADKAPMGMGSPNLSIRAAKEAAKEFLYKNGKLAEEDLTKPLVLFIGRFQYNKGLAYFERAAKSVQERGGKFVIMGQPNNFPAKSVTNLERFYPKTVKVIADERTQQEWGIYWRTACDFLLVPSLTESFGLVAAEGLLFGATVISSGVGGLSEFLIDRPNPRDSKQQAALAAAVLEEKLLPPSSSSGASSSTSPSSSSSSISNALLMMSPEQAMSNEQREEAFNSYMFDVFAPDAEEQLATSIQEAIANWRKLRMQPEKDEAFLNRLVNSALSMGWDRPGGPVDQYHALYEIALGNIGFSSAS